MDSDCSHETRDGGVRAGAQCEAGLSLCWVAISVQSGVGSEPKLLELTPWGLSPSWPCSLSVCLPLCLHRDLWPRVGKCWGKWGSWGLSAHIVCRQRSQLALTYCLRRHLWLFPFFGSDTAWCAIPLCPSQHTTVLSLHHSHPFVEPHHWTTWTLGAWLRISCGRAARCGPRPESYLRCTAWVSSVVADTLSPRVCPGWGHLCTPQSSLLPTHCCSRSNDTLWCGMRRTKAFAQLVCMLRKLWETQ